MQISFFIPVTKKRILFLCTGNSCRSQMAEGFARQYAPAGYTAASAGLGPKGYLHPRAVIVMQEVGIDIRNQSSKPFDFSHAKDYDLVVTLCGDAEERCPALPAGVSRTHWPLPDPAKATGSTEEVMETFRRVRDEIGELVKRLFTELELQGK
ncbi:MAG: arsenate reductase ArsC [candidate division Zixibacteria bacterium]|nr:arsenate reductase ArsC [candidate division Zixibacteria bacterium]